MVLVEDLLNPSVATKLKRHKLKDLVQKPRSFHMDARCGLCERITIIYSHTQTTIFCGGCMTILCTPTGGKAQLTRGCAYRRTHYIDPELC